MIYENINSIVIIEPHAQGCLYKLYLNGSKIGYLHGLGLEEATVVKTILEQTKSNLNLQLRTHTGNGCLYVDSIKTLPDKSTDGV